METALLRHIPLFDELSDEQLTELSSLLREQRFSANDPIFWIGEQGAHFYVIQSGEIALSFPDLSGNDMTLAVLSAGQFFGEIALLDGGPRTATARARGDVVLLSLSRAEFLRFLTAHPSAAIHMLTVLGRRQRESVDKLRGIKNVNEVIRERQTTWNRVADTIAAVSASQAFVIVHLVWFLAWVGYNLLRGENGFDPFPFGLLTMVVSLEAILLSIFILVSQNRAGEKDRLRADLDYQVNLKAHYEIMQLHQKLDRLATAVEKSADRATPGSL